MCLSLVTVIWNSRSETELHLHWPRIAIWEVGSRGEVTTATGGVAGPEWMELHGLHYVIKKTPSCCALTAKLSPAEKQTAGCILWGLATLAWGFLVPDLDPVPPAGGAWSLNHWTTRESPPPPYIPYKFCDLCLVTQSCLILCDPWTVSHQAPLTMGFSRQE